MSLKPPPWAAQLGGDRSQPMPLGWFRREDKSPPWCGGHGMDGGAARRPRGAPAPLPVDVTLGQADLLIHGVPEVRLQRIEVLPHGREEAAVDSVHHLQGPGGFLRGAAGSPPAPWSSASPSLLHREEAALEQGSVCGAMGRQGVDTDREARAPPGGTACSELCTDPSVVQGQEAFSHRRYEHRDEGTGSTREASAGRT